MGDPRKPNPFKVYEIANKADTAEETVKLLAEAFPLADTQYIAELFRKREKEQSKQIAALNLEKRASKAMVTFLTDSGFVNLAEACEDLGLEPQELWNQIMREAGVPEHEMPVMIQVAQEH